MNPFDQYKKQNRDNFVRTVGLPLEKFQYLVKQIRVVLQVQTDRNPLKKRGLKSELSLENQVLLTLLYLRDYPTFIQLGLQLGISESYAHKIYPKMLTLLVRILHVKSRQALFDNPIETLIVDVTEQPIERPQQGQQAYFSGKKKTHHQSSIDDLFSHLSHFKWLL